ncbi:MAG: hypothetical protein ABI196_13425 [Bradyrhizobium sp.]
MVEFIALAPVSGMAMQMSRLAADPHFADIAGDCHLPASAI